MFDDTARHGLYQATKRIPRKVNKLAMTALRLAAERKAQLVDESVLCSTPPPRRCCDLIR